MEQKFFSDLFCYQCSLQFGGKSVYYLHQSLVHGKSGDSEVKIEISSEISEPTNLTKTSTLQSSEKINLNVHNESIRCENKPFKCNACDGSFSQKKYLNRHIKLDH
jgi:hypothetical protein